MPGPWQCRRRTVIASICLTAGAALWPTAAAAQTASYFSPTYAASDGSPYSDVYARTFGSGGPPPARPGPLGPPLTTAAPPIPPLPESKVVYVIETGRLLTIAAEDYARGREAPLAAVLLPPDSEAPALQEQELPSVADRLYGAEPLETAGGGAGTPIRLVPPQN